MWLKYWQQNSVSFACLFLDCCIKPLIDLLNRRFPTQSCFTVRQVALLYMLSRLVVNVSGTYAPFYVLYTLSLDKVPCSLELFAIIVRPRTDEFQLLLC